MAWYDFWKQGYKATRRVDGSWSYFLDPTSQFGNSSDHLNLSLTNIALFTAFDIRSTMFSRAKVVVVDSNDKEIEDDPFLQLIANPNFCESQSDHLKKHLWFKSLGTGITRAMPKRKGADIHQIENVDALEHLIPSLVDYQDFQKHGDFVRSRSQKKEINERQIKYKISGKDHLIDVKDLAFFYDVACNMTDEGFFKSPSRIDAVHNELKNIQEAQSSKNKNLVFSAKWLATNKGMEMNVKTALKPDEKQEIEQNLFNKSMNATNADVNVEALANDMRKLMLDGSLSADAMRVFSVFHINRNVLDWWEKGGSGLGDNGSMIEKGVAEWIQNSIQLEGDDYANTWTTFFGYQEQKKKIKLIYSDLPVMQVLEKERIQGVKTQADILKTLIDSQVPLKDALRISGLDETEA